MQSDFDADTSSRAGSETQTSHVVTDLALDLPWAFSHPAD